MTTILGVITEAVNSAVLYIGAVTGYDRRYYSSKVAEIRSRYQPHIDEVDNEIKALGKPLSLDQYDQWAEQVKPLNDSLLHLHLKMDDEINMLSRYTRKYVSA